MMLSNISEILSDGFAYVPIKSNEFVGRYTCLNATTNALD